MTTRKKATPPKVIEGEGGPTSAGWHMTSQFLQCPKMYQYQVVRKVKQPLTTIPDYFAVGILFHAGRAKWFARNFDTSGETWSIIQDVVRSEAEKQNLPIRKDAVETALRYLLEYVNHWSVRPKPQPVATEYMIGPAPLVLGDTPESYRTARVDDVSRYPEGGGGLYIGEAKTDGESIDNCTDTYMLHGQPLLQILLWKTSEQGEKKLGPVKGVMLDVLAKGRKGQKSKFGRVPITVTDSSLAWFADSMRFYLQAAAKVQWDTPTPRNITQCKRCPYRELCKYGKSAAGRYVGADGNSLIRWKPVEGQSVPPWE